MELQVIQNRIYEIRGQQVMIDFDLAEMYHIETKRLKEQVKRNLDRFPKDFMFQLTKTEWDELVAKCDQLRPTIKHSSVIPLVFTQEGVAMFPGSKQAPSAHRIREIACRYQLLNEEAAMPRLNT